MYIYIFIEIAAIIYLPFHWSAKNLSLQYRSQVNIRASTHMWNKSIRSQGKLISYSGRLRNSGFEILCQDFISFLSIIFNSSVLCPHPHRTPEPRSKVSENFIFCVCVFVKMYSFSHFTNHETSSLLTYKHIIRNICKIFEWTLGMFTEYLKALCRLWPKCTPYLPNNLRSYIVNFLMSKWTASYTVYISQLEKKTRNQYQQQKTTMWCQKICVVSHLHTCQHADYTWWSYL